MPRNVKMNRNISMFKSQDRDLTILLHPNIPKPLHGTNPRTIMGRQEWQLVCKYIKKNVYHCQACGERSTSLDCHETYHIQYETGLARFIKYVAICKDCHNYIHCGRLKYLLDAGKITKSEYERILRRGNALLASANLKHPDPPTRVAAWEDWRLLYNNTLYKGKFKNIHEWRQFYKNGGGED